MASATVLVVLLLGSVVLFSVICVAALLALRRQWNNTEDTQSSSGRPTRSRR
ncbi:MAG TPA: hypothetical protein VGP82_20255 [Ktedonobacterales bacterium]|nr:hypothetical protein [Ktedonobacterales bacterium]